MPMRDRLARLVQRNPERPTLRQRAAALKASAAKVMRRPEPAAAPPANAEAAPVVLPGTDAEFLRLEREWDEARGREEAAYARQREIAPGGSGLGPAPQGMPEWREWHEKVREWRTSSGIEEAEEDGKHWCGVVDDIARQIAALPATSLTGMRVKARVLRYFEEIQVDPVSGLVGGLASDVLALAPEALPEDASAMALVDAIEREWGSWSAASARDYQARGPEVDARHEARCARRDALLYAAIALPATSRAERHAKALAHAWIGVVEAWRFQRPREDYKFDELLAFDIDAALSPDGMASDPNCPLAAEDVALSAEEPAAVVASPDADLIALGRRFDGAHAGWMALVPASVAAHDRMEAFRRRAVNKGMGETDAFKAAWLQDGVSSAHEAEEAAFAALEPLNEAIMALPAHTVEGLAVKARAAIPTVWASGDFEADRALGDHENWERRGVRDLIDACMTLARRQAVGGLPSGGRIEKAGAVAAGGMVLYEDASGALSRGSVASWVNFMAQRLYGIASSELSRQYSQQCGDDAEFNAALDNRLRRDLRLDALKELAFRPDQAFQRAAAERSGDAESASDRFANDALRLFDFEAMTPFEVMTLHNHARAIRHVAHGLLAMPCSRRGASDRVLFNAAGALPGLIADLAGNVMDNCITEARSPREDLDAEAERLSVLAEQVIFDGDVEPIRTLARDLVALADRG